MKLETPSHAETLKPKQTMETLHPGSDRIKQDINSSQAYIEPAHMATYFAGWMIISHDKR